MCPGILPPRAGGLTGWGAAIPVAAFPVAAFPVATIPVAAIPVAAIPMAGFPMAAPGAPVGKERFRRGQLPTSAQLHMVRFRTSQSVRCLTVSEALSLSGGGVCWPNWHPGPHSAAAWGLGFPTQGPLELTCWLLRMSGGPVCGHRRASGAAPAPEPQDKLTLLEYGPGWVSWGGSSHPPRGAASGRGGGSPEAESAWGSGRVGPGLVGHSRQHGQSTVELWRDPEPSWDWPQLASA